MGNFFGPPRPAYNNPPIAPQNFKPSRFFISNITLGITTTVTTSVPHNYIIGQLVRLLIPFPYGSIQLNEQLGYVIAVPTPNQIIIDLNSQSTTQYIPLPIINNQRPQVVAVGDSWSGVISTTGRTVPTTTIPGSFQNISPQ